MVTIVLDADPPGLSEQARALVAAFPQRSGVRTVHVDVRNRHWAALVIEIVQATEGGA